MERLKTLYCNFTCSSAIATCEKEQYGVHYLYSPVFSIKDTVSGVANYKFTWNSNDAGEKLSVNRTINDIGTFEDFLASRYRRPTYTYTAKDRAGNVSRGSVTIPGNYSCVCNSTSSCSDKSLGIK